MMPPRRWLDRCAVAGLATCVVGCFTDAPPLEDDTGSTSGGPTTDPEGDASGATMSVGDDADDDSATLDTSGTTTTAGSEESPGDAEAESETGTPECGCPDGVVLCDDFDDDELDGWLPPAGDPEPRIDDEMVHCGAGSLRAEMPADASVSTISALVQDDAPLGAPWSFGGWYFVSGACPQGTGIRILRLWLDDDDMAPPQYLVDLVLHLDELRLRATNDVDVQMEGVLLNFSVDAWVEFRIDFDLTNPSTPVVVATIGDELVSVPVPPVAPTLETLYTYPTLGTFREGISMSDQTCVVHYDDIWFGPTPG